MDLTTEQQHLRESYVLALIEATTPLQQQAKDPKLTLELLIQAADILKQRLLAEQTECREEGD